LAAGQSELPEHLSPRAAQQTVEDFSFDERGQHGDVPWLIQQPEQAEERGSAGAQRGHV
jgi:hypothetical protein